MADLLPAGYRWLSVFICYHTLTATRYQWTWFGNSTFYLIFTIIIPVTSNLRVSSVDCRPLRHSYRNSKRVTQRRLSCPAFCGFRHGSPRDKFCCDVSSTRSRRSLEPFSAVGRWQGRFEDFRWQFVIFYGSRRIKILGKNALLVRFRGLLFVGVHR